MKAAARHLKPWQWAVGLYAVGVSVLALLSVSLRGIAHWAVA